MPRKIRQLKADLRRAGFVEDTSRGRGDHSWWEHELAPAFPVNLDGQIGADAKPYQERQLRAAIAAVEQAQGEAAMSGQFDPARYTLIIEWSDEDEAYIATAPELPGCRTHGATRAEALRKGEEIIGEWLAIAADRGWTPPSPRTFDGRPHIPAAFIDADAVASS